MSISSEQTVLNSALRRRVVTLQQQGWKPAEIAEMLNIPLALVSGWLYVRATQPAAGREDDLLRKMRPNPSDLEPDPLVLSLQVLELKQQGYSPEVIGKRLDVPVDLVQHWLQANKLIAVRNRALTTPKTQTKLTVAQQQELARLLAEPPRVYGLNEKYWSSQAICVLIHRTFGISFKVSHLPRLLRCIRELLLIELMNTAG